MQQLTQSNDSQENTEPAQEVPQEVKKLVEVVEGHRSFGNKPDYLEGVDQIEDLHLRREVLQYFAQFSNSHFQKIINKIKEISDEGIRTGALRFVIYKGHPSAIQYAATGLAELSDVVQSQHQLRDLIENSPERAHKAAVHALNKQVERYVSLPLEQKQEAFKLVLEYATDSKALKKTIDDIMAMDNQHAKLNLLIYAGEQGQESLTKGQRSKLGEAIRKNLDYFRAMHNDNNLRAQVVRFGINNTKQPYNNEMYNMILEAHDPHLRIKCLKYVVNHARVELATDALHHISRAHDKAAVAHALLDIAKETKYISVAKEARKILIEHMDTYQAVASFDINIRLNDYQNKNQTLGARLKEVFKL